MKKKRARSRQILLAKELNIIKLKDKAAKESKSSEYTQYMTT